MARHEDDRTHGEGKGPQVHRRTRGAPAALLRLALMAVVTMPCLSCKPSKDLQDGPNLVRDDVPVTTPCDNPPNVQELDVVINEVVLQNESSLEDEYGEFPAWVEFYNPTAEPVNMGRIPLSDTFVQPSTWLFPCVPEAIIEPGGFLIVFLDGDTENENDFHANFRVDPTRSVTLVLNGGSHIVTISPSTVAPDRALGSFPDGEGPLVPLEEPTPGGPNAVPDVPLDVVINELVLDNEASHPDEEGAFPPWIEVFNRSTTVSADLRGVALSYDAAEPAVWQFPDRPEAVMAPRSFLLVYLDGDTGDAGDFHASFRPEITKTVTLILDDGTDTVSIEPEDIAPDQSRGRYPDGRSDLLALAEPTPGAPNAEPVAPPQDEFERGDVNADGVVNVADTVTLLNFIFRGGSEPGCLDAADTNDDGRLNVSDPIGLLHRLFGGAGALPPPSGGCGRDPSDDSLPCDSYPPCREG